MKAIHLTLLLMVCLAFVQGQSNQTPPEIPGKIQIDRLENIFKPVDFDHRLHAEMAVMGEGCVTCHHHAEDEIYAPCGDCHLEVEEEASLAMPTLNGAYHRNCLNCHRDWSADHRCETCHAKQKLRFNTRRSLDATDFLAHPHKEIKIPDVLHFVRPESKQKPVLFHHQEHVELYRLQCEHCHRQTRCATCHKEAMAPSQKVMTLTVHHAPCSSCHDTQTETDCSQCHRDTPSDGFSHELTGWALNRFHIPLKCEQCHSGTSPITALDQNCISCHDNFMLGAFDHSVTGLQLTDGHEEIDCGDCHGAGRFDQTPSCVACHDEDLAYPEDIPGIRISKN